MRKTILASSVLIFGYVVLSSISCGSALTGPGDGGGGDAGSGGTGGGAGAGGAAGASGSAGSAGTGGSAGTTGSAGSAGTGGSAGTAGAAGSGGAGGSGGMSSEGGMPVDAMVTCGKKAGFGSSSAGDASGPMSCSTGVDYKCGIDAYKITCECSEATCTCARDKAIVGMSAYSGCPGCGTTPDFAVVAAACGIPF